MTNRNDSKIRRLNNKYKVLIIAVILYLPFIFFGYGSDCDSYQVLDSGNILWETGYYRPSRNPGYIVHEMATMVLNKIGGSIVSNLGTLAMSVLALWCFIDICEWFSVPNRNLLALCMAVHPFIWPNATCTMDYMWAIGLMLLGFKLLLDRRYLMSTLILSLATGARLSSFIGLIVFFVFIWVSYPSDRKRILIAAMMACLLNGAFYFLSFVNANYTLNFLQAEGIGGPELWTLNLWLGRFIYKNIYLWGLQGSVFIMLIIVSAIARNSYSQPELKHKQVAILSVVMILFYELLFLKYPLETAYLLPMLPFVLILLGIGIKHKPVLLVFFVIVLLSSNFITFNIARPNIPNEATDSSFGFWVEPGYLIKNLKFRIRLKNCNSRTEYSEIVYN